MLFSPESHEPLTAAAWDERRARDGIAAIVTQAQRDRDADGVWPVHPLDEPDDPPRPYTGVYVGAAGVVWALHELGADGDWAAAAAGLDDRYRQAPDYGPEAPGLWLGRGGIVAVAELLAPDARRRDTLRALGDGNAQHPCIEVMWGAPGSMLIASALLDRTGDPRWAASWSRLADAVWEAWIEDEAAGCRVWTQDLYGTLRKMLGPAHGMAGCIAALRARPDLLGAARAAELDREAVRALSALAVRDDGLANWPPIAAGPLTAGPADVPQPIRTQWCHGAPGMVATLANVAPHDAGFTDLLVAGGELTWRAGPLVKGPGLCHGTAGNGLAFLALHARTGKERWLGRARAFAMHALEQVARARAEYGHGRSSLWTGDLGVALYVRSCLDPARPIGIDMGCR